MKATEQSFPAVLFIMPLYKVVLTFESLDEILKGDHDSNESCRAVLSNSAVYYAVLGGSKFRVCG